MRQITSVLDAKIVINDEAMHLRRALPQASQVATGPFVFVDHYRSDSLRGIGDTPHPHAGIEVISYLLEGRSEHRDSMGYRDVMEAGDAQVIRAGRGMIHAERPLSGRHGLQLWTSLPPDRKMDEPTYTFLKAADIPVTQTDGARLYVMAGQVNGMIGPMELLGRATFARVRLDPDATTTLDVDDALALSLYVLEGEVCVGDVALKAGMLGNLSEGAAVHLSASGTAPVEVALLGGDTVIGPVLFSGPFVMDTAERLEQTKRNFAAGRMGRLEGTPF